MSSLIHGEVLFEQQAGIARVTLHNPARFNAMSRTMWRALRSTFESIQSNPSIACVIVSGEGTHFCSGGDISEYPSFRFHASSLKDFHENDVWGALQAILDCDVPIVAQIEGNCMGAGVEIASCCDIRLASMSAQFGAPIARLGFPMAPREARLVSRELGVGVARRMLLEAAILSAAEMKACGFLGQVVADHETKTEAYATATRIAALAPQAARLNKQTLRQLLKPTGVGHTLHSNPEAEIDPFQHAYAYADTAEHREGVRAFIEKRKPVF